MRTTGILLMTYGSPRSLDDVGPYMTRIRGGKAPSDDLLVEFRRRYELIGGSPLIPITLRQAAALERELDARTDRGSYLARAAMRFSEPSVDAVARELVHAGADRLVGLILSPQYSPILMSGYVSALSQAADRLGVPSKTIESWHLEPSFVRVIADRIQSGLERFPLEERDRVPVLLTAHSLPKRVVDREPGYVEQLEATARAVAAAAGLPPDRWVFAYQSAGHTPEEWLKPDLLDILPVLAKAGHRRVLLAPVQFLADHLETLYDIDVAGREQAEEAGFVQFERVPAPNDAADFAAALADVVQRSVAAPEPRGMAARSLG